MTTAAHSSHRQNVVGLLLAGVVGVLLVIFNAVRVLDTRLSGVVKKVDF